MNVSPQHLLPPGPHPPWTGIGGLPHATLADAVRWVRAAYPEVPFLPQIATEDAGATILRDVLPAGLTPVATAGGLALPYDLDAPALRDAFASAPADIPAVRHIADAAPHFAASSRPSRLKAQITGPVTLASCLRDRARRPLASDTAWFRRLGRYIAAVIPEVLRALRAITDDPILWIDEPSLGLLPAESVHAAFHDALVPVLDAIAAAGARPGLHCCSAPPLARLLDLPPCDLSLDAVHHGGVIVDGASGLAASLLRGGRLVLGAVPVLPVEATSPSPLDILDALTATTLLTRDELVERLVLSPSCGTLLAPLSREQEIVQDLSALSHAIADWGDRVERDS